MKILPKQSATKQSYLVKFNLSQSEGNKTQNKKARLHKRTENLYYLNTHVKIH